MTIQAFRFNVHEIIVILTENKEMLTLPNTHRMLTLTDSTLDAWAIFSNKNVF